MQLDPVRLEELGLRRQPFPEDALLHDHTLQTRTNRIIELLKTSSGTVLVTGPVGVGVSRLVLQVEGTDDSSLRLLTIDGEAHPTPDDICHACLEAFDLPPAPATSGPKLLDYVADWLDSLAQASDRPALLVDNAHDLSEQTLDALLSMQEGEDEDYIGPALLLAGAPELEERVARLGELMDDDHFHVFRLEPWTRKQVAIYIEEGLERAGADEDAPAAELLDPDDIHLRSGGYPAQVRAACLQALNGPVQPQGGFIDRLALPSVTPIAQMPAALRNRQAVVIIIAGLLFLVVAAFTLLRDGGDRGPAEHELVLQPRPVPAQSSSPPERDRATDREVEAPEPAASELPSIPVPEEPTEPAADAERAEAEPESPPVPVEPTEAQPDTATTEAEPEEVQEPTADDAPTVAAEEEAEAAPHIGNTMARSGADWLASRPAERYTIQIVAAGNPDTLEAFVQDQSNRSALRIVPTQRDGQTWFVVVAGDYADRDAARSGLESLPSSQRDHGPWVRTFGSLATED